MRKVASVVLAASSQESVRLLLNSKSKLFPQGLANSSGKVGKYITDSVQSSSLSAHIPAFENMPIHNEDGAGGPHAYVPWTLHDQNRHGEFGFPGGYHLEFTSGRQMPSLNAEWHRQSSRQRERACMAKAQGGGAALYGCQARLRRAGHDAAE
jgi:hypothetical protein